MSKFCTKCGKKLEEGQKCDCEKNQKEKVASTTSSIDVNSYINSYIEIVKGIFTKPVNTIKKFATSDHFILGIIALILNSMISGIFLYCVSKEAMGSFTNLMGGYNSLLLGTTSIEIPFFKTFLYGILFMIVGFAVTALMIYLIAGSMMKDKIDIKKAFSLVGVCSVFTTVTTIAAILLTYLSIKIMIVVLLIAGIFYLTYLYQGIEEVTEINKNKLAYVFVPAISIATFVVVYILPKILF